MAVPKYARRYLFIFLLPAFSAAAATQDEALQKCIVANLQAAEDSVTVGELRKICEFEVQGNAQATPDSESPTSVRERYEHTNIGGPFSLLAHRPTFLLPYSFNAKVNNNQAIGPDAVNSPERSEAGFQISFKFPVWRDVLGTGDNLFMAYTNRSFWQIYDRAGSSPFRSTDHEPELFWRHHSDKKIGSIEFPGFDLGFSHQSNGRSKPLSRSWNRIVSSTAFNAGDLTLGFRGWLRIQENSSDDDNPDIEDYMGYGEARLIWAPDENTLTAMLRPAKKGGAVELTWSRQISSAIRLYAQFYNGHGETLVDYDHRVRRYSIGISLNDYLINKDKSN